MCPKEQEVRSQCLNWPVKKGKIGTPFRNLAANAGKELAELKEGVWGVRVRGDRSDDYCFILCVY